MSALDSYKTFRQFPLLHASLREINKSHALRSSETKRVGSAAGPRSTSLASASAEPRVSMLKELSRSCLAEITHLSAFRSEILSTKYRLSDAHSRAGLSARHVPVDPFESAEQKLTKASISFNSTSAFNELSGFNDRFTTLEFFHAQVKHCLHVSLSTQEERAVFEHFRRGDETTIDGNKFIRYFFKLGNMARNKIRFELANRIKLADLELERKKLDATETKRLQQDEQVSFEYTSEDKERVLKVLADASLKFDDAIDPVRYGFSSLLTPYDFKLQIERVINVRLNAAEAGAMVDHFKIAGDPDRLVDGIMFTNRFRRMRGTAWDEHSRTQRNIAGRAIKLRKLGQTVDSYFPSLGR